ncbi:MAG: glycosyltransferase [Candidatus Promineifilaceae bacterium]
MLNFHIIYTPDTAQLLVPFVKSLLRHSDCHFRLVSNHCTNKDKQILKSTCQKETRLTYIDLPTTEKPWDHGDALNYLYERDRSEYFCFMDSDIFAAGPFMHQFLPYMESYAGIFSCSSMWMRESNKTLPLESRSVAGRFNRSKHGHCLGSTYFAIYRRDKIDKLMSSLNMRMAKCRWSDIDLETQVKLAHLELKHEQYDTARVLNLSLLAGGHKLYFAESTDLVHIGGVSAHKVRNGLLKKKGLSQFAFNLPEGRLRHKLLRFSVQRSWRLERHHLWQTGSYEAQRADTVVRKVIVSRYFTQLLTALTKSTAMPTIPMVDDKVIQAAIVNATQLIVAQYEDRF